MCYPGLDYRARAVKAGETQEPLARSILPTILPLSKSASGKVHLNFVPVIFLQYVSLKKIT